MRKIKSSLFIVLISLSGFGFAQENQIEIVADDVCNKLEEVSLGLPREDRYTAIKESISSSILYNGIMKTLVYDTEKALDSLSKIEEFKSNDTLHIATDGNVIIADENYDEIEEFLLRNCDRMKLLMTNDEASSEVSISDKKKARELYDKGLEAFEAENYEVAIKFYKKAIRKDNNFAFAWDMLGYSHRRLEQYEEAIKAYDESLKLDPKGRMPLMNKPIAYSLMGNIDEAIVGYKKFIDLFPGDPEGQYGIGRMYHIQGDYELALESTIQALIGYSKINSPYARDAEANLGLYYRELKEQGKLEIWDVFAKKHNINIED